MRVKAYIGGRRRRDDLPQRPAIHRHWRQAGIVSRLEVLPCGV